MKNKAGEVHSLIMITSQVEEEERRRKGKERSGRDEYLSLKGARHLGSTRAKDLGTVRVILSTKSNYKHPLPKDNDS